jgi:glycerol kinase
VDGGACANNYLIQFQSDLLRIKIDRPVCKESTALGVAFMAGIKAGVWNMEQLPSIRKTEKVFDCKMSTEIAEAKYDKWAKAVESIRKWSN